MENPPILFLDFDGVLHPFGEAAVDENYRLLPNPRLFCWRSILEDLLAPYPAVKIIVSSDWRRLFDQASLSVLLGEQLAERLVGVVEVDKESRAEEILAEAARRELRRWLAIDDHPSVVDARYAGDVRFVVCTSETGLGNPAVQRELGQRLAELGAARTRV